MTCFIAALGSGTSGCIITDVRIERRRSAAPDERTQDRPAGHRHHGAWRRMRADSLSELVRMALLAGILKAEPADKS